MDIKNFVENINNVSNSMKSEFTEMDVNYKLVIDKINILYPKNNGGNGMLNCDEWLKEKHQNGRIHERGLVSFLIALKRNNIYPGRFLDIGAHYGYFTIFFAKLFSGSKILAVDINKDSLNSLKNNCLCNDIMENVKILPKVISDRDEKNLKIISGFNQLDFSITKFIYLFFRSIFLSFINRSRVNFPITTQLRSITMRKLCEENLFDPDIIKIDVEGFQAKFLPSSMEFLKLHRPIVIVEFDTRETMKKFNTSNIELSKPIISMNYKFIWGDHRANISKFEFIDSIVDTKNDLEVNSLGIFMPDELFD